MTNLLQDGADWLIGQLGDHASRAVVYEQGTGPLKGLAGTCTAQEYEVPDEESGLPQKITMLDWTFRSSDLGALVPRSGDRITETLNGQTITYELLPVGRRPCCENADTAGLILIVHTKRVA